MGVIGTVVLGIRQAVRLLARRPWTTLASALFCGLALYLPLLAATWADAVAAAADRFKLAPEISLFVAAGAGSAEIKTLMSRVESVAGVVRVEWISREAGLAQLRQRAPVGSSLPELTPSVIPDVVVAKLDPGLRPGDLGTAAAAMRKLPRVEAVHFDGDWHRKLGAALHAGLAVLLVIGGWAVALVAAVLIGAVRLQAGGAASELRLLQLVGADRSFIRRPYIYGGAVVLFMGGMVALALVVATTHFLGPLLAELAQAYEGNFTLAPPALPTVVALLAGCLVFGALVAWIGTTTSPDFPR
jgi:cell division transport system permease protein